MIVYTEKEIQHRFKFDMAIGQLDRILSTLIAMSQLPALDDDDKQTLKHHAEDMKGAADKILAIIGKKPNEQAAVSLAGTVVCNQCQKPLNRFELESGVCDACNPSKPLIPPPGYQRPSPIDTVQEGFDGGR